MKSKRFDELKSTGLLPSPTGVGLEILRLMQNDCTSIEAIVRVLQADPALTGRVLKYANSGNAASSRPITSIHDAVVRVGLRAVNGISLGFSLLSNSHQGICARFNYRRYWSHSLALAFGAQALIRKSSDLSPADGFLAGLLGQIGRLALATIHPEKYAEVLAASVGASCQELLHLEQSAFATDHNELTAAMLDDWGLPEFISAAILHHEHPASCELSDESKGKQLAQLLFAAQSLADICVVEDDLGAAAILPEFLRRVERLGIDVDELITLVDDTIRQWQEWGSLLNVATRSLPSLADLLILRSESKADLEQPIAPSQRSEEEIAAPVGAEREPTAPLLTPVVNRGKGLRILVADDDPVTVHVLTALLTSSGHDVIGAYDGGEALRLSLEKNPQLIITDWNMPETDGVQLCRSVRRSAFGRQVYIIVLTSHSDDEHLIEAFEAGADDYIVKPFQARALFARIRAGLRVIKLQDEITKETEQSEKFSAELAIANRRLEMDALYDMLTGLPNRRYFGERLSHDWILSRRSGEPLACMVLDIDHFKWVNDTHGHDVGDRVLECVAKTLKASARGSDIVCRHGGEEFVVLRVDSDRSIIQQAERLRMAVQTEVASAFPQIGRSITVSIGVAVRNEHTRSPESLVKAADEAMYLAKQSGRNRVCRAGKAPLDGDKSPAGDVPVSEISPARTDEMVSQLER